MYPYLGDFPTGATIFFPFNTFDSNGASITLTGLAVTDIEVYKGASMTQRSSDAGYALVDTDGIDLDTITGIHGFTIDTSDNTDAGFYAAGNDYTVVVSSVTVDTRTVNFIAGRFSIDNRGLLRPTTAQRTLDVSATGAAGLDFNNAEIPVGPIDALNWLENGTMQAGSTSTTAVLRAATSLANDIINNSIIYIRSGTGAGQSRYITDWVSATDTATIDPVWGTTPDNTSVYAVIPAPPASNTSPIPVDVQMVNGNAAAADNMNDFFSGTGYNAAASTVGTVASVTAVAADGITASSIATGAIDADAVAADAATEIAAAVFARAFSAAYGSYTFDEMVKLIAAVLVGKASGLAGTTATFRNLADNADVVVATVDADGNRTAVTKTP